MSKSYPRQERIADLILRELALFLQRATNDPRLQQVSITAVKVSSDKSRARVFFNVLEKETAKEVEQVLNKASGYYRSLLAKSSGLRFTPSLHFEYDFSILYGSDLSRLIDQS